MGSVTFNSQIELPQIVAVYIADGVRGIFKGQFFLSFLDIFLVLIISCVE